MGSNPSQIEARPSFEWQLLPTDQAYGFLGLLLRSLLPERRARIQMKLTEIIWNRPSHSISRTGSPGQQARKLAIVAPLPPQEARDWMTPNETALALGCSVATVHRLRRGLIPGVEPLPCSQYGRKFVFRKASIARWQDNNEKGGLA